MFAKATSLNSRGMTIKMKQKIKVEDPMLVELVLSDSNVVRACCEPVHCSEIMDDAEYEVDVEFIIIKDNDKMFIESLVNKRAF